MRASLLSALAALAAVPLLGAADAPHDRAPIAQVRVSIGPKLEAKAREYGQRDLDGLAGDLKRDVERQLAQKGRMARDGATLELVIVDAKPSRPTFAQMGRNPSLSMRSLYTGGARIEGVESGTRGRRTLSYSYWESDIRNERGSVTWTDADRAFDMFARDYAAGKR